MTKGGFRFQSTAAGNFASTSKRKLLLGLVGRHEHLAEPVAGVSEWRIGGRDVLLERIDSAHFLRQERHLDDMEVLPLSVYAPRHWE